MNKNQVSKIVNSVKKYVDEFTSEKKLKYVTQAEYDALADEQKNDTTIVWNIIDAENIDKEYIDKELSKKSNVGHRHDASEIDNLPSGGGGEVEGGGNSNLLARYVHSGNKELHPISFDIATGIYTCSEPHGITDDIDVIPMKKLGSSFFNIPKELYSWNVDYKASKVDELSFKIKVSNNYLTYDETDNTEVDITKFYFDCCSVTKLIINLNRPSKAVKVHIEGTTGIGDLYISAYYDGYDNFATQGQSIGNNYRGATRISGNVTHNTPRFFTASAYFSCIAGSLICDTRVAQFGYKGRTAEMGSLSQSSSVCDFDRDVIESIRLGSPVHVWTITNNFTVTVFDASNEI